MKMKNLLMIAIATFGLAAISMAQVPSYVPTNGLVGWWPFNGNTNDESGNGLNGTGAGSPTLTQDRFSVANKAYSFDGIGDYIAVARNYQTAFSLSIWFKPSNSSQYNPLVDAFDANWEVQLKNTSPDYVSFITSINYQEFISTQTTTTNNWYHLVCTYSSNTVTFYLNGNQTDQFTVNPLPNNNGNYYFGASITGADQFYIGKLDDIGIWNRVLTQQEITNLYNAANCANNTAITPQTNSLATGSTATFTASTTDPNPTYVWQSDLGQGFQTLNNFGNYSGVNTASLNVTNVQLSEHNQPIRVISTSGNCIDTSNVAVINILDTCITNVTIYDTILTTVTDTLIINATITGLNPPSNQNTLKVYPNPANTHITIDYGNFSSMNGYTLKIVNTTGQTVFTTFINQQNSYIDLSTWTGNGIYYVQLIDTQNNTIENRKIVIH